MTLKITLNNGQVFFPMFAPEHLEAVLDYYQNELEAFGILAYELTY